MRPICTRPLCGPDRPRGAKIAFAPLHTAHHTKRSGRCSGSEVGPVCAGVFDPGILRPQKSPGLEPCVRGLVAILRAPLLVGACSHTSLSRRATAPLPAVCPRTYRAGISGDFHRPAFWRSTKLAPCWASAWAVPMRNEWPLAPMMLAARAASLMTSRAPSAVSRRRGSIGRPSASF